MQTKELLNLADTIHGEVNRLCVTDDITELYRLSVHVENNIKKLCSMRYADFEKIHKDKPKNDSISRKAAIKMFLDEGMPTAAVYIERVPDATPQKIGKWIKRKNGALGFNCSCCGKSDISDHFAYCPSCGAEMRG